MTMWNKQFALKVLIFIKPCQPSQSKWSRHDRLLNTYVSRFSIAPSKRMASKSVWISGTIRELFSTTPVTDCVANKATDGYDAACYSYAGVLTSTYTQSNKIANTARACLIIVGKNPFSMTAWVKFVSTRKQLVKGGLCNLMLTVTKSWACDSRMKFWSKWVYTLSIEKLTRSWAKILEDCV